MTSEEYNKSDYIVDDRSISKLYKINKTSPRPLPNQMGFYIWCYNLLGCLHNEKVNEFYTTEEAIIKYPEYFV